MVCRKENKDNEILNDNRKSIFSRKFLLLVFITQMLHYKPKAHNPRPLNFERWVLSMELASCHPSGD